jgi:hypothetical protein
MHLSVLGWLGLVLLLLLKMCVAVQSNNSDSNRPSRATPPPTPSSYLAQRRVPGVRLARQNAMSPIYGRTRSPRASTRRNALQDMSNQGPRGNLPLSSSPSLEAECLAARNADRDRQLALQETPSRRRRRIPNENRPGSPTPGASRPRAQAPLVRFLDLYWAQNSQFNRAFRHRRLQVEQLLQHLQMHGQMASVHGSRMLHRLDAQMNPKVQHRVPHRMRALRASDDGESERGNNARMDSCPHHRQHGTTAIVQH